MKKIIIFILIILFALFFFFQREQKLSRQSTNPLINSSNITQEEESFIFVPYWTFSDSLEVNGYDNVIYFGVTYDENGISRNEDGFSKLNIFSSNVSPDKKTYLTLRILGEDADSNFLDNQNLQEKVGADLRQIANEFGFEGVVIDYETSAFGFSSTESRINKMYKTLHDEIKKSNLEFLITVFGDNYYRARPYNIKELNNIADKVIIMAYDFHKARLNPGPNFPFSNKDKYGYDFQTMIKDFEKDLDYKKIVVALGYFGYDWKLENGVSVEMAEPLSFNQIKSFYLDSCDFERCKAEVNSDNESVIRYVDGEGFDHEVWFEDEKSSRKKIEFLNSIGINQIAFWAYSYY